MQQATAKTITQDPIIDLYHYDVDGVYTDTSKSVNDPLAGQRMIPAFATEAILPTAVLGKIAVFDGVANTWSLLDDFRGDVYRVADGSVETWAKVGTLPATFTTKKPNSSQHAWDAKAKKWVIDLAQVRVDKINALKSDYQALRQGGVNHAGTVFDGDDASINTLAGVLTAVSNGWTLPTGFVWIDANNVPQPANIKFLQALAIAMADAKAQQFGRLQTAKAAVIIATTKTAINGVVLYGQIPYLPVE